MATPIQGTNDSSTTSKSSMSQAGYFNDKFISHFIKKRKRRTPLINRGYYVRVKTIDRLIRKFLSAFQESSPSTRLQIVSFGAGFDSSFFRLHEDGLLNNTTYFEVDFVDVLKNKVAVISEIEALRSAIRDWSSCDNSKSLVLQSRNYKAVGVDLCNLKELQAALSEAGLNEQLPTLFLSECVLTYLAVPSSSAIIEWVSKHFSRAVFITYEQVYPNDGFGTCMRRHFSTIASKLKGIETFPTPASQEQRYLSLGWDVCRAVNMYSYYNTLTASERCRIENLEPFDEYEEWHLKCSHYVMTVAANGDCCSLLHTLPRTTEPDYEPYSVNRLQKWHLHSHAKFQAKMFGHCSVDVDGIVFIAGGFGTVGTCSEKHQRLSNVLAVELQTGSWTNLSFLVRECEFATLTKLGENLILLGGRTSPLRPVVTVILLHAQKLLSVYAAKKCNVVGEKASSCSTPTKTQNIELENTSKNHQKDIGPVVSRLTCDFYPRWRHTATAVSYDGEPCLFVYGGRSIDKGHHDGEKWNFPLEKRDRKYLVLEESLLGKVVDSEVKWTKFTTRGVSPGPRFSHTCSQWDDKLVLACGLNEDYQPLSSVFILDLCKKEWCELEVFPNLRPRYSHTAHILHRYLILVGGVGTDCEHSPGVAIINLDTGRHEEFKLPEQEDSNPVLFHGHTSHLRGDGKLFVIGGGGNCFSFGTHLNSSPLMMDLRSCCSWMDVS